MTPEGRIKVRIDALLKLHNAYYLKPVQNGMGAPALDYHGIHMGRGFVIEAKAPGKEPTERQARTMRSVMKAGGQVFFVDGDAQLKHLADWLNGAYSDE